MLSASDWPSFGVPLSPFGFLGCHLGSRCPGATWAAWGCPLDVVVNWTLKWVECMRNQRGVRIRELHKIPQNNIWYDPGLVAVIVGGAGCLHHTLKVIHVNKKRRLIQALLNVRGPFQKSTNLVFYPTEAKWWQWHILFDGTNQTLFWSSDFEGNGPNSDSLHINNFLIICNGPF